MSSAERVDRRQPLLLPVSRHYEDSIENSGCCKVTTIITSVLFFCGVLALGLAFTFFFVVEKLELDKNSSFPESSSNFPSEVFTEKITVQPSSTVSTSAPQGEVVVFKKHVTSTSASVSHPTTKHCDQRIVGFYSENELSEITKSQLRKLTHAVFAYIRMNADGTLQFKDEEVKRRFLDLRKESKTLKSSLKIMISIGGPDNSVNFPKVIMDVMKQKIFIESIISFLKEYRLDGVDLFWKWPKEYQKHEFTRFLNELKYTSKLQNEEYVVSVTAPAPGIDGWENGFDLNEILKHVDFINVLTMDYYGPWDSIWGNPTGPSSPLYSKVDVKKNVDYSMEHYVCDTSQPFKFNIVIPFHVKLWKNVQEALSPENIMFRRVELKNSKAEGNAYMSRWTVGRENWKISNATWDEETKSSYIWNPVAKTYLTFESDESIAAKMEYVKSMNLGGVWIWFVDQDDVKNSLLGSVFNHKECSTVEKNIVNYKC
ncbi:hypothetical protein CRE_01671 [Caenorhabditis remanei]|uniref:GH18 domain-containing protein n=1 Tax=Caenorhabditis remanei TaxID=31234 RepID=E3LH38_CAERE|nr:hypothetical protein CRE_01671 [Caenorhabditis remanei]